jgi:spermidine synthase
MIQRQQWEDPDIVLVDSTDGELTLLIEGEQAMQAWERELMWASADMLCEFGSNFLEVGLGLGISALRIAVHPNTRHHVVVERYQRVIDLFRNRNPSLPPALHIVQADAFQYVAEIPRGTLDGIFFDPFMPAALENEKALWDEFMPLAIGALRPGGAFIPFFTTEPILKWPFFHYFERLVIEKHAYVTYPKTRYTHGQTGTAYIQCFVAGL